MIAKKLGALVALFGSLPFSFAAASTVLECGFVLDVERERIVADQRIFLDDGVIKAIGEDVIVPEDAEVVDLSDQYCAPGLMDMHVHLFIDVRTKTIDQAAPTQSSAYNALMGLRNAQTLLSLGFTTIRVPGDLDYHYAGVDLKRAFEQGWYTGPRMLVAPHPISPLGGHGDLNSYAPDLPYKIHGHKIADGVDDVRRAVREQIKYGADWIKVMASGGVISQHDDPEVAAYTQAEFNAMADEAHRHKKKITAHAHGDAGIRMAVMAGFDSIEHGTMMSTETARLMAKKGTFLVPTLYAIDWIVENGRKGGISQNSLAKAQRVSRQHAQSVQMAHEAGVPLVIGSDPVFSMNQSIHEFQALAKRIPDNWAVLQAGTLNAARMLGLEDEIGSLEVGKKADIVAMPGNPVEDISSVENISFVMKGGAVIRRQPSRSTR